MPIAMQNIHKLTFRAILSSMLIEIIPVMKEERQPMATSKNPGTGNPHVSFKPISAARTAGTLMRNESFKADSLFSLLNRRNEIVIPERDMPGKAENP